ncbi:MAG TPA: hypothetical protein VFW77_05050 [Candidatus Saccharimonadales bacterium]|nr:hypothetical protein [Candidatus Saccharimonadales bacterium]
MKFWPSYKSYSVHKGIYKFWYIERFVLYSILALLIVGVLGLLVQNSSIYSENGSTFSAPNFSYTVLFRKPHKVKPVKTDRKSQKDTLKTVITTIFWVGEPADKDNNFISNLSSAWINDWQDEYGGFDNPLYRTGYRPKSFKPKENPFYIALPYDDLNQAGKRKNTSILCPNKDKPDLRNYSWCKNSWIMIKSHGKTTYAQWEDVGPYETDDVNYVFGNSTPKNTYGAKAGLDVSPAVRDYLGLADVDTCSWKFVKASKVPNGPWKKTVTSSKGYKVG